MRVLQDDIYVQVILNESIKMQDSVYNRQLFGARKEKIKNTFVVFLYDCIRKH